jgi:hypothetical protein
MTVWFSAGTARGSKVWADGGRPIMISGPANIAWNASSVIG